MIFLKTFARNNNIDHYLPYFQAKRSRKNSIVKKVQFFSRGTNAFRSGRSLPQPTIMSIGRVCVALATGFSQDVPLLFLAISFQEMKGHKGTFSPEVFPTVPIVLIIFPFKTFTRYFPRVSKLKLGLLPRKVLKVLEEDCISEMAGQGSCHKFLSLP